MEELKTLTDLDFPSILIGTFVILCAIRFTVTCLEWVCSKLGIEFRWMQKNRELKDNLVKVSDSIDKISMQMDTLCMKTELAEAASREALADRINQKYKYYLQINGIPEDEVDEFAHLHAAYKGVGGNHSGDTKYEYCMTHLPIIPVETRLHYGDDDPNGFDGNSDTMEGKEGTNWK